MLPLGMYLVNAPGKQSPGQASASVRVLMPLGSPAAGSRAAQRGRQRGSSDLWLLQLGEAEMRGGVRVAALRVAAGVATHRPAKAALLAAQGHLGSGPACRRLPEECAQGFAATPWRPDAAVQCFLARQTCREI